jgi:hypothetical protein
MLVRPWMLPDAASGWGARTGIPTTRGWPEREKEADGGWCTLMDVVPVTVRAWPRRHGGAARPVDNLLHGRKNNRGMRAGLVLGERKRLGRK